VSRPEDENLHSVHLVTRAPIDSDDSSRRLHNKLPGRWTLVLCEVICFAGWKGTEIRCVRFVFLEYLGRSVCESVSRDKTDISRTG
jgi:hypothetical protein